ncbi:unnamed protein product [Auanema sp. JU1783]|nr:unnamed protein product [Auanema sp. JU1783]
MRNLPLFLFLFGLVFFFYLFYIYQAQSTELAILREQLENLQQINVNTKKQLIDAKAEIEKFRNVEEAMKNENVECINKFDECTTQLRNAKLKVDNDVLEKNKLERTIKDKEDLVIELRRSVAEGERNTTSLKSLLSSQEVISRQLNEKVEILKKEMAALKGTANSLSRNIENPVNEQVPQFKVHETAVEVTTTLSSAVLNSFDLVAQRPHEGEVPQLALPVGPGDRVKLEDQAEEPARDADKSLARDEDYNEKKHPPAPDTLLENGGEQL